MSDKNAETKKKEHKAPKGKKSSHKLKIGKQTIEYSANADWLILRANEKPRAEMFHVSYITKGAKSDARPVTFVFNGGPGASSAYLHVGALGPKRVVFNPDGSAQKPPAKLVDNTTSWLAFTDLVFIDPIGTGFSRMVEEEKKKDEKSDDKPEAKPSKEYYQLKRDLESLGEFIQKFLSVNKRWDSPVFIAGESYGGFRVAKLAKLLQEGYGIGLNGAILISPSLEWMLLDPSDYDVLHWVDIFPTMALSARYHSKSRIDCGSDAELKQLAEEFAVTDLSTYLVQGERLATDKRQEIYHRVADFLGLEKEMIERHTGRIPFWVFCRNLLKSTREVCGFYDATIKAIDPFPDRETHQAPDPTLYAIERVFAGGINTQLRQNLELATPRDYSLLIEHMKLTDSQKERMTIRHFKGGHMFYAWEESRIEFTASMREFYAASV